MYWKTGGYTITEFTAETDLYRVKKTKKAFYINSKGGETNDMYLHHFLKALASDGFIDDDEAEVLFTLSSGKKRVVVTHKELKKAIEKYYDYLDEQAEMQREIEKD